jgi:hypothetical protein
VLKWLLCLLALPASAVVLAWNSSPGATGYNLYQGPAHGFFTNSYDCRGDLQFTNHLAPGTYYFAVTATNSIGESGFSSELVYISPTNTLIINVALEKSYTVTTGYVVLTNWVLGPKPIETNAFFRARLTATITNQ